jgi:hypothetical protein
MALTTGLSWSNHEGHEGHEEGDRRAAESHDRLFDRGSLASRAASKRWYRTLLCPIPSCSSCASWSTDHGDPLVRHGNIPRRWETSRFTSAGESLGFELESDTCLPGGLGSSPLRALTAGLSRCNHEGHEGHEEGIRQAAESHDRLLDRGSLARRAGSKRWYRTLLCLIPSCSSCASWSTDHGDPLVRHGNIPRRWETSRFTNAGE